MSELLGPPCLLCLLLLVALGLLPLPGAAVPADAVRCSNVRWPSAAAASLHALPHVAHPPALLSAAHTWPLSAGASPACGRLLAAASNLFHAPLCPVQASTWPLSDGAWPASGPPSRWWPLSCPTCAGATSSRPSAPSTLLPPLSGQAQRRSLERQGRQQRRQRRSQRMWPLHRLCPSRCRRPWRTPPAHRPPSKSRRPLSARPTEAMRAPHATTSLSTEPNCPSSDVWVLAWD